MKVSNRLGQQGALSKLLIIVPAAFLFVSCYGKVDRPEVAVKKMIKAFGGAEKVELLQSYSGKGFMKVISSTAVAKSNPFDVYQNGVMFKNKIMKLSEGKLVDVMITVYDGREGYQWHYGEGRKNVSGWEFDILEYRFPRILKWVQESGIQGEIVTEEYDWDVCRVRYYNDDDIVTLILDNKSWLLEGVELASRSDTTYSYSEAYGNYREVEGVPFPNRFTGTFKGRLYYEYFVPAIEYGITLQDTMFKVTRQDTIDISRPAKVDESDTLK